MLEYKEGDLVKMKKSHPCGTDEFEILSIKGAITLRCTKCERIVDFTKSNFEKYVRKIFREGKFLSIR